MSYELPAVQAAEAKVLRRLKPGFNHISDTPDLEAAYYAYEAKRLDATYKDDPSVVRINQLPADQQSQIGAVAMRLVNGGLLSADIAQKRLQRIRVRTVDEGPIIKGEVMGGEFKQGLATVKDYADPAVKKHAVLHEVTHGLTVPGWATGDLGFIAQFNGGLDSVLTAEQEQVEPDYVSVLHGMQEAIIDTTALGAGNLNVRDYLSDKYEMGYAPEARKLITMTTRQPELVAEAMHAVYTTGLQSVDQAHRIADAFASA